MCVIRKRKYSYGITSPVGAPHNKPGNSFPENLQDVRGS